MKQKRINLLNLRKENGLTQEEFAKRIGYNRNAYTQIEIGARNGKDRFWYAIQSEFEIPDEKMWDLKKLEEVKTDENETA